MANVKLLFLNQATGYHQEASPASDNVQVGKVSTTLGADMGGATITAVGTPVNPTDAATMAYVDQKAAGLSPKDSVVVLADTNIASLSGTTTIQSVALVAGQAVLLKAQTNAVQNGFWIVQSGAWVRPVWFPSGGSQANQTGAAGAYTYIEEGTYATQQWACTNVPGSDTIDTSPLTFGQTASAFNYTQGNGITISGGQIAVNTSVPNGLTFASGALAVATNATGGIANTSTGIAAVLNGTTLQSGASGISVKGLGLSFEINTVATNNTVTAAALNTLTAGVSSPADSLHTHAAAAGAKNQQGTYTNGTVGALAIGAPVCWSSTADVIVGAIPTVDSTSYVFGVAAAAIPVSTSGVIVTSGIVTGAFSAFTPGGEVWLSAAGGLTQTKPTAVSTRIIRVGIAKNLTDLWVQIIDQGKTSP